MEHTLKEVDGKGTKRNIQPEKLDLQLKTLK